MMTANAENQIPDDQVDAPLDRAEILRLVKASRNAGYNSTQDSFARPDQGFKPLSIRDMAALSTKPVAESSEDTPPRETPDQSTAESMEAPAAGSADDTPDNPQSGTAETAEEKQVTSAAATEGAPETAEEAQKDAGDNLSAGDVPSADQPKDEESEDAPHDPSAPGNMETIGEQVNKAAESTDHSAPEDPASFDEIKEKMDAVSRLKPAPEGETESEEYQRGYEDGRKAALAEKETEMNEAVAAFTSATEALSKDENFDLSQLSPAISRAIMELASERAGIAIDEHPDAFAARIESMVKRIRNRVDEPYIRLHPEDAKIIGDTLGENLSPRKIHIIADENLKRGDARIDVGSIGVMDLISSRIADSDKPAAEKDEAEHD